MKATTSPRTLSSRSLKRLVLCFWMRLTVLVGFIPLWMLDVIITLTGESDYESMRLDSYLKMDEMWERYSAENDQPSRREPEAASGRKDT